MFRSFTIHAAGCGVLGLALAAATNVRADEPRQPEVVVTATRTPVAQSDALASVSVIDREAIETSGGSDLVTLLRGQAGVDIVRSGGLGQQTSVFLRGSNSNHVLVLIDGVRVAASTTGGYAWEHLPLQQIERIEIVRGPRAALFGSDAIGGVIQIFTRRDSGAQAALGGGSHRTWLAEAAYGQRGERSGFGLRAATTDSAGFNAQRPDSFGFDPDRDGYRQHTLGADAELRGERVRARAQLLAIRADVEFDPGVSDLEQRMASLSLDGGGEDPWQLSLASNREDLETEVFASRFQTRRWQLEAQRAQRSGERGEWLYGASLVDDEGRSINTFSNVAQYDEARRQRAVFASWRDGRGALDWQLGARHDRYDSFGGETSLQAALGWRVDERLRLRAGSAEGFRAPNVNELYSPGFSGLFRGNPDLRPERSRGLELGADWELGRGNLSLSAYRNRVSELISFSGGAVFQAINIRQADLRGVELEAGTAWGDWQFSANLGWQRARDVEAGTALLRRAARKGTLAAERGLGTARVGLELHAVSSRPDFGVELPGYALLGGWLRWPLSPALDLDLRIDNAFDRDYSLLSGYTTPGASASLQLRWKAR